MQEFAPAFLKNTKENIKIVTLATHIRRQRTHFPLIILLFIAAIIMSVLVPASVINAQAERKDTAFGAVWNRDDSRILSWWREGTARVWDATSGEELVILDHNGAGVQSAKWNEDEKLILTWAFDSTARVWDATSGAELLTLSDVTGAIWNEKNRLILTWSNNDTARVWNYFTGAELLTLRHEDDVRGGVWNKDESRILSWSSDDTARVWDSSSGTELLTLRHEGDVKGAVWNKDESRILSWSSDGTARVWDTSSGAELLKMQHGIMARAVWNRDESRILMWSDGVAVVRDALSGELLLTMNHGTINNMPGAIWNRDESRVLTWSDDGTARVWDENAILGPLMTLQHEKGVNGAVWNSNETFILTSSSDGTARVWDASSGAEVLRLQHEGLEDAFVKGAVWSNAESQILTWSGDGTVRVWDIESGMATLILGPSGDGTAVASAQDGETSELITQTFLLDEPGRLHWDIRISPNDEQILAISEGPKVCDLLVWDIENGPPPLAIGLKTACGIARISNNGDRLLAFLRDRDDEFKIINMNSGEELRSGEAEWVSMSPTGKYLYFVPKQRPTEICQGTLIEIDSLAIVRFFDHPSCVERVAAPQFVGWVSNDQGLIIKENNHVLQYDFETKNTFEIIGDWWWWSPSSKYVVEISRNQTIGIRDSSTGEYILQADVSNLTSDPYDIEKLISPGSMLFNKSETMLAAILGTKVVVWNIETGELKTLYSQALDTVELRQAPLSNRALYDIYWSGDGQKLALLPWTSLNINVEEQVALDPMVRVWDVGSSEEILAIPVIELLQEGETTINFHGLSWSPEGDQLFVFVQGLIPTNDSSDMRMHVINLSGQEVLIQPIPGRIANPKSLDAFNWHEDGKHLGMLLAERDPESGDTQYMFISMDMTSVLES